MNKTPSSIRPHIGIFGRANVGKSSFLNVVTGQAVSIVSPVPGTTTDVVRKNMELLPLGPVTFLDTAGMDDASDIGPLRVGKTREALRESDVAVLVLEPGVWTEYESDLVRECSGQNTPLLFVVNKTDAREPEREWLTGLRRRSPHILAWSCARAALDLRYREECVSGFKRLLLDACPDTLLDPQTILGDLLPRGRGLALAVLIVPIDTQAPKGRLILPQVQSIRDALDTNASVAVVKETEFTAFLDRLNRAPDLVVCDSQVARRMAEETPPGIPCTTFSILFSRFKGDIEAMARGAAAISRLKSGDRVLISEACTHHPLEDDIGRVKIPRWMRQFTGAEPDIHHCAGRDYPADIGTYSLIVHCGACTLTRREMLWRIERAREAGVPITNYGIAISALQGVIERTLSPFPDALEAYRNELAVPALEARAP